MRVRAIINRGGGTLAAAGEDDHEARLRAAFERAGVEAEVRTVGGDRLADEFREAAEDAAVDSVVAGGGDGTVSAAAGALAGTDKSLGILPLGTLNHLARDAGIPTDPEAAVATVAAGHVRPIDAAEVNGRIFVNNSAIGLYPHMVRRREEEQHRLGRSKRLAMVTASLHALWRFSRHRLTIDLGGVRAPLETPLLFVGNNVYETSLLTLGARKALDRAELCLYAPTVRGRLGFLGLGLRSVVGLGKQRDFVSLTGISEATVFSRRASLNVSLDGETELIATPLRYRIRPAALRLIVPPPPTEGR